MSHHYDAYQAFSDHGRGPYSQGFGSRFPETSTGNGGYGRQSGPVNVNTSLLNAGDYSARGHSQYGMNYNQGYGGGTVLRGGMGGEGGYGSVPSGYYDPYNESSAAGGGSDPLGYGGENNELDAETIAALEERLVAKASLVSPPSVLVWSDLSKEVKRRLSWLELCIDITVALTLATMCWVLRTVLFPTSSSSPVLNPSVISWAIHDFILITVSLWLLWHATVLYWARFGAVDLWHMIMFILLCSSFAAFAIELPSHLPAFSSSSSLHSLLSSSSPVIPSLVLTLCLLRSILIICYLRVLIADVARPFAATHALAHTLSASLLLLPLFLPFTASFFRVALWCIFGLEMMIPTLFVTVLPPEWHVKLNHQRFVERLGTLFVILGAIAFTPIFLTQASSASSTPSSSSSITHFISVHSTLFFDIAITVTAFAALLGLYLMIDATEFDTHALRRSCCHGLVWSFGHAFLIAGALFIITGVTQHALYDTPGPIYNFTVNEYALGTHVNTETSAQMTTTMDPTWVQTNPRTKTTTSYLSPSQNDDSNPLPTLSSSSSSQVLASSTKKQKVIVTSSSPSLPPISPPPYPSSYPSSYPTNTPLPTPSTNDIKLTLLLTFVGVGMTVFCLLVFRSLHHRAGLLTVLRARELHHRYRLHGDIYGYTDFPEDDSTIKSRREPTLPRAVQIMGFVHLGIYLGVTALSFYIAISPPSFVIALSALTTRAIVAMAFLLVVAAEAGDRLVAVSFLHPNHRSVGDPSFGGTHDRGINYTL